jgi:hypothetical protein
MNCNSVCIDAVPSVASKVRGFVTKVREVNPEIRFDHFLIHYEATVASTSEEHVR